MKEQIMARLNGREKAWDMFDLADAIGAPATEVSEALAALASEGRVGITKRGRYTTPDRMGLVAARTLVLRSGAPVARPLDGGHDLRISRSGDLRAMADDLILVRVDRPGEAGDMGYCELEAITKRAHPTLNAWIVLDEAKPQKKAAKSQGKDVKRGRKGKRGKRREEPAEAAPPSLAARACDHRITSEIRLAGDLRGARPGDMVSLKVLEWPAHRVPLVAEVQEVLGRADEIGAQLRALASDHGFALNFAPDAVRESLEMPSSVAPADLTGRLDLRKLLTFTIDGNDAQDFDDAVSLTREGDVYHLGVHIADVSHYVRQGSAIDREAQERGTSLYLPGLTFPMLPQALSNELCSLKPNADRLTMSLTMDVRHGEVIHYQLAQAVIRSSARLTYEGVNRFFAGDENAAPLAAAAPPAVAAPLAVRGALNDMLALSHLLRAARAMKGGIDLDLPEAAFALDAEGRPTDVYARERGEGERLIEDFMLLANETVAKLAREARLPFLYRVHGRPDADKLRALEGFLRGLNIKARLGEEPEPRRLQEVLEATKDLGSADVIKQILLRSMKRAMYSDKPEGHFGLAMKDYCHFTSPIRRYPDLEAHRMLKRMLAGKRFDGLEKRMAELAGQCSATEYAATVAEREADSLLKAHYMAEKIGAVYGGVVAGVTGWGFYVALPNTVEGLVHLRTLRDAYALDEEHFRLVGALTKRQIRLGDRVRVRVDRVDVQSREIDFILLDE